MVALARVAVFLADRCVRVFRAAGAALRCAAALSTNATLPAAFPIVFAAATNAFSTCVEEVVFFLGIGQEGSPFNDDIQVPAVVAGIIHSRFGAIFMHHCDGSASSSF